MYIKFMKILSDIVLPVTYICACVCVRILKNPNKNTSWYNAFSFLNYSAKLCKTMIKSEVNLKLFSTELFRLKTIKI